MPTEGSDVYSVLVTALYAGLIGGITLALEVARRYILHRLRLWEARHPVPGKEDDDE